MDQRLESLIRTYEQQGRQEKHLAAILAERMRIGDLPEENVALAGELGCVGAKLIYPKRHSMSTVLGQYFKGSEKESSLVIRMCYDFILQAIEELKEDKVMKPVKAYLENAENLLEEIGHEKRKNTEKNKDLRATLISRVNDGYDQVEAINYQLDQELYRAVWLYETLINYVDAVFYNSRGNAPFSLSIGGVLSEYITEVANIQDNDNDKDMVCGYLLS